MYQKFPYFLSVIDFFLKLKNTFWNFTALREIYFYDCLSKNFFGEVFIHNFLFFFHYDLKLYTFQFLQNYQLIFIHSENI